MAELTVENAAVEKIGTAFERLRAALGSDATQLWSDASEFYADAQSGPEDQPDCKSRLMRAAVLGAAAAFESTTNYLAEEIAVRGSVGTRHLTETEVDIRRERRRVLEGGIIKERKALYSSMNRFLLLYRLLSGGSDYGKKVTGELTESFEIRDRLVHPKPGAPVSALPHEQLVAAVLGFFRADLALAVVWGKLAGGEQGANRSVN
jgi:hypothetical protein